MDSFISWIGGKKALRKKIIQEFPEESRYNRYIEVFGGAGWVLFGKDRHAEMEVFNDVNGALINLYRCVKYHPEELQRELEFYILSREQFFDCRVQVDVRGLTDIQRAARFFILIRESFGADIHSFRTSGRDMKKCVDCLAEVSKRLNSVIIEHLDCEHLIKTYDRSQALFYLDPPYYEAEKYYPDRFNPEDHDRLAECLKSIKGMFLLSYNDNPQIRALYKGFRIIEVSRINNLSNRKGRDRYNELIIKNF